MWGFLWLFFHLNGIIGFHELESCLLQIAVIETSHVEILVFSFLRTCFVIHWQYAKLGLSLVVPGGGIKKKAAATPQAKPEGATTTAAEEDEDEYAGGLC